MPPAAAEGDASREEEQAAAVGGVEDDDEHDSKERVLQKYFLQEWSLVKSILHDIVSAGAVSDLSSVHKIRSILDKYQEQGQLLEPYMESIVTPLMLVIRSKATQFGVKSDEVLQVLKPISIIIYTLVTVCGYKAVVKFLPHQVSDLELAVALLEKCHDTNAVTSIREESMGEMEAKCVMLLWLSILVLIPFDISSVDTSIVQSDFGNGDGSETPPLVLRVVGFCKDYLSSAGPMRSITSLLLAKFLTRPDMGKVLASFVQWTQEILSSSPENLVDHFRLLGAVETLAAIFKAGSRTVLLDLVPIVWDGASTLMKSHISSRSPLLRKYLVKFSQRIGLACLPHRSPSWCYKGRVTSLPANISPGAPELSDKSSHPDHTNFNEDGSIVYEQEEDMDVPEVVEEIMEVLLTGLKDTDTVVRWSAAKGIGRITSRLTYSLSDEVLSSVMELFSPHEGDGSWHGACLALAELARRGLLLPISLPKVVPVVAKALHYDVRRGPHSIGAHVRDAAAYVCWAFGRAYYHLDMRTILEQLAPHLLTIACYDREVNCRRAASAAFQENVGRQGNYLHGIEIVNMADYFALSSRVNSYLRVAVLVAEFDGYLYPFVDELLSSKICHWDKGLRELSGKALSVLVKYNPGYHANFVLEKVIPCTLSSDLCTRHGATLAAGELVMALNQCGYVLSTDKQKQLAGVVPAIEKARLYRGKGGEIMRSAVSRFIQCISFSHIPLTEKIKRSLLDTLNDNLRHPNSQIQNAAVEALKQFVPAYLQQNGDKDGYNIVQKYLEQLRDPNVSARRGSALALGGLPYEYLIKSWRDVLSKLSASCAIEDNPEDRDAEARVNAVKGLVSVCEILTEPRDVAWLGGEDDEMTLFQFIKDVVIQSLFGALDDYSVDNRGDVGSWVRQAAMDGLERCTYILCRRDTENSQPELRPEQLSENYAATVHLFDTEIATKLVGGLVKLGVEKMDKLREAAAGVLCRLLYNRTIFVPFIPHRQKIEEIISDEKELKWAEPTFAYPRFVKLLDLGCYRGYVLSGLVIAIGGLQDSLRRASLMALLDYLQAAGQVKADDLNKWESREMILSTEIIWVLQEYRKCDRVIVPTLKTIEILLNKQILLNKESHTADFCAEVLKSIAIELRGTKDFSKLHSGIAILGHIASLQEPVGTEAFSVLLTYLTYRFPKIRKSAAEQVYLVLLQNGILVPLECTEKALEIVSETCWEGGIEDAKQRKLELYELAGLDARPVKKIVVSAKESARQMPPNGDENASYASLVNSSGF
ncbi:hypothetical protein Droror1_Dr00015820 [Drosera rotundifolia]